MHFTELYGSSVELFSDEFVIIQHDNASSGKSAKQNVGMRRHLAGTCRKSTPAQQDVRCCQNLVEWLGTISELWPVGSVLFALLTK